MTKSIAALLVGGAFVATQAMADAPDAVGSNINVLEGAPDSYVNSGGNAVKTGLGECLRLGNWSDDNTVGSCEGEEGEAVAEAEAEPAAVPTAPAEPIVSTSLFDGEAFFDTDESVLTAAAEESLSDLLAQLERMDGVSAIQVVGHTDSRGDEAYNQQLSEARAASVQAFLAGVYPDVNITAIGEGENAPVASNSTPEGRQQNRRVEVRVTAQSVINPS
jgi:OOP family OmpA-OmpF porin